MCLDEFDLLIYEIDLHAWVNPSVLHKVTEFELSAFLVRANFLCVV